jgi:hypothetical protein
MSADELKRKLRHGARAVYLMVGDLDKPFHRPECECDACESWRRSRGRPTRRELQGGGGGAGGGTTE